MSTADNPRETLPLYWSVRRELWENRSILMAPLIVTAVVLFATSVSVMVTLVRAMRSLDSLRQPASVIRHFNMAPAPIMLTTFIVAMFYCIDALYSERRDRSILFWKSMPVSDLTTVISKVCIPFVVLPAIALLLSVLTQIVLIQLSSAMLIANGVSPGRSLAGFRFFAGIPIMIYGVGVHVLWFAPIYGWLMLVSAWARRATFLWAVLPFVAVSALERIVFGTSYFVSLIAYRFKGAMIEAFADGTNGNVVRFSQLRLGRFLTTPGLWLGLIFAAACFAVAVRLRRNREPI